MIDEPMRILQVFSIMNRGGAESMIMNLYRNIDKSKIQFDFVVHHDREGAFDDEILSLGGKIYHCPSFSFSRFFKYKKWWKTFLRNHSEYKVLHSHVRSTASIYIPIAKKNGLKTIIHSHSTSNGQGVSALIKTILQYPLRYQADCLMSCSSGAGEWLFGKKCNSPKYHFLPNAIDLDNYKYDPQKVQALKKDQKIENKKVYCHVGNFRAAKNHVFLIEVFKLILTEEKDSVLLLVGDGELRSEVMQLIEKKHLNDNVRLMGIRDDVPIILNASDVFLFPSKWEGLPVTIIESQAASLPSIISDSITKDVDITKLVKRLPIDNPIEWAKEAVRTSGKCNVIDQIKAAGYDVHESVKTIIKTYEELLKS